jgi:oligoendopeptidase F
VTNHVPPRPIVFIAGNLIIFLRILITKSTNYTQKRWSLADIYPSEKDFNKDFKTIEKLTEDFEKLRPVLKESISDADFISVIKALEGISRLAHKMGSDASLWFTEDMQNQSALGLVAKTEQQQSEIGNRTFFLACGGRNCRTASPNG